MQPRVPFWLTLVWMAWMAVWVPTYWIHNGPDNFLWLCDTANFVMAVALVTSSPLLFSSQATGVLFIQLVWTFDFLGRLVLGFHPVGGTEYMFDPGTALWLRLLSLFHVVMPILLVWALRTFGYDRRGFAVQTVLTWILLPTVFFLTAPKDNINWVWRPFDMEQSILSPNAYLVFCLVAYPLVLYLPTHLLLKRWVHPAR